jgi:hypothetical protein
VETTVSTESSVGGECTLPASRYADNVHGTCPVALLSSPFNGTLDEAGDGVRWSGWNHKPFACRTQAYPQSFGDINNFEPGALITALT